jgi:methionine biosynthesis protein MetW
VSDELRAQRAWAYENPRPDVQALVPPTARRVLDIGCSSGALGAALKERQDVEIVGLEIDPGYAADAARRLDRVVVGDLAELAARDDLEADLGRFDCLIAADVLEHLVDPWSVLARFGTLVDPGDSAVVSLPNIRFWETFWQLGRHGRFPRRSEGIFDRTHLRWFTAADAHDLLGAAGFDVVTVSRQMRLRPAYDPKWDARVRALERTPLRSFFTFQHVLAGRKRA